MGDVTDDGNTSVVIQSPNTMCLGNVTINVTADCIGLDNGTVLNDSIVTGGGLSKSLLFGFEISFTFLDIFTVLGNGLLMLVIYKATKLKEGPGRILLNQAVADGGVGLLWLILYGCMYFIEDFSIIKTVMLVQRISMFVLTAESVHSLTMMLFTLHLAICNPISYTLYDKTLHTVLFLVLSWPINVGTWLLTFMIEDFFIFERGSIIILLNVTTHNVWFAVLIILVDYLIPLTIIVVCQIRIGRYLKDSHLNSEVQTQSTTKNIVRQARGILLASIVYMFTFLPLFLYGMFAYKGITTMGRNTMFILGTTLAFTNYIYVVAKFSLFLLAFKSFRRAFLNLFCCCRPKGTEISRAPEINPISMSNNLKSEKTATQSSDDGKTSDTNLDSGLDLDHDLTKSRPQGKVNDGYECSPDDIGFDTIEGTVRGNDDKLVDGDLTGRHSCYM